MRKIAITGANGFLGKNLAAKFAADGYQVICFSKGNDDTLGEFSNITFLNSQIEDILNFTNYPETKDIDVLYHFAWSGVSNVYKNNPNIQAQNIFYGLKVLDFAHKCDIKKVVFPGSAAEFSCTGGIINGQGVSSPSDVYAASKISTRLLCEAYAKQLGVGFIWTLITSVYGPGRDDNNLISYTIKSLLAGEKPSFTKLEQEWDYIYIEDLLSALIKVGESGRTGKIYPIGSGQHRKMIEYVQEIRSLIDPDLPIGIGDLPYKNGKIDHQILDISELKRDTGFVPEFSFEKGILLTIEFFKKQLNEKDSSYS